MTTPMHRLPLALRFAMAACALCASAHAAAATATPAVASADGTLVLASKPWLRHLGAQTVEVSLFATQASTPAGFVALPGAKRLRVLLKQAMSADQVGRLLTQGIEAHSTRFEVMRHAGSLFGMGEVIAQRRQMAAGESFALEAVPGGGTRLLINDLPVGSLMGDPSLFAVLARAWLGDIAR